MFNSCEIKTFKYSNSKSELFKIIRLILLCFSKYTIIKQFSIILLKSVFIAVIIFFFTIGQKLKSLYTNFLLILLILIFLIQIL